MENVLVHSLSTETEFSRSSLDEVDVHYEGSLAASDSFSSCSGDNESQNSFKMFYNNNENCRTTPDIVRTICKSKLKNNLIKSDSYRSLAESEVDHGFQSDVSVGTGISTYRKLEELQEQFAKMQKDIAGLVQLHSLQENGSVWQHDIGSLFSPIMSSSPSVRPPRSEASLAVPCVPPPCGPPPPPPAPSSPLSWKQALLKTKSQICSSAPRRNLPDMSEVLKGISSVKLRPVRLNNESKPNDSKDFSSFIPRVPLRSVTRHESIIAVALRERFQQFRMLSNSNDSIAAEITDDWSDDADNSVSMTTTTVANNRSVYNVGRALLRKVDRSKLPETVSKDFLDKSLSNTD